MYCFILPVFSPFSQYWLVRVCFKPAVLHPDSSLPHALREVWKTVLAVRDEKDMSWHVAGLLVHITAQ